LQARDPLACRFTQLRESGISKEEAWKLMAVEILTEAGLVAPERAEMVLGADPLRMSSVVRQALRLGLDELERRRYQK
jgi:hypothetical protein